MHLLAPRACIENDLHFEFPREIQRELIVLTKSAQHQNARASASTRTTYVEDKNTEIPFTPSLCDLRASVFQIFQPQGNCKISNCATSKRASECIVNPRKNCTRSHVELVLTQLQNLHCELVFQVFPLSCRGARYQAIDAVEPEQQRGLRADPCDE